MDTIASQITSLATVYSTVYLNADQRKHQKLRVIGLCAGNSPGTGEFPAQIANNAVIFFITSSFFDAFFRVSHWNKGSSNRWFVAQYF